MLNFEIRKKYFAILAKKISDIYATITGIPPFSLPNSKGKNLKSYSISGNVDEEIIEYSDGTSIEEKPNLLRTAGRTEQAVSDGGTGEKRLLQCDKYIKGIAINNSLIAYATTNVQIGANGVSCNISTVGGTVALPIKLKNNVSYSINATISSGGQIRIISYQKDGTFNGEISTSASGTVKRFTVPNNADIVCILLRRAGSTDKNPYTFSDIMLVEGVYTTSNAPAYTPYKQLLTDLNGVGDYDNTTNKYKIPVLSSGKNFYKQATRQGVTNTNQLTFADSSPVKKGRYTFSFKVEDATKWRLYIRAFTASGGTVSIVDYIGNLNRSMYSGGNYYQSSNDITFTDLSFNVYQDCNIVVAPIYGTSTTSTVIYDCQLEFGDEVTPYEPYVAGTSNNIFINNSLFKTGENVDTVNYPQNKTIKAVGKYVFTGTETIELYDNSKGFRFAVSDMETGNCIDGYCNRFENFKNVTDNDVPKVFFGYNNNYVYFRRFSDTATTVEAIKATLANWYSSGKPLTIWYPLEEEVEEAITLPDIPTIRGNATITIDTEVQPSSVTVEYAIEGA